MRLEPYIKTCVVRKIIFDLAGIQRSCSVSNVTLGLNIIHGVCVQCLWQRHLHKNFKQTSKEHWSILFREKWCFLYRSDSMHSISFPLYAIWELRHFFKSLFFSFHTYTSSLYPAETLC